MAREPEIPDEPSTDGSTPYRCAVSNKGIIIYHADAKSDVWIESDHTAEDMLGDGR